jgi:hypothetical protein
VSPNPIVLLALVALGCAAVAAPAAAQLPPPSTPTARVGSPTLAVEDTMRVALPEEIIRAPRVSLDEILRRVAEGEARRDSMMQDQVFTMLAALTYLDDGKDASQSVVRQWESATRVYRKRPDKVRTVTLRQKSNFKNDDGANVTVGSSMAEELVTFAFSPRTRSKFKFEILERHLVGNHVIYVIGFTPRSRLDDLPTGKAWIDTNEFVIVRQEFWYRDRSPAPLFFESIESCIIERTQVDGRWWVLSRVLARVKVTSLARFMARVGKQKLTPTIDLTLATRDWQVNRGIDDAIFDVKGKK